MICKTCFALFKMRRKLYDLSNDKSIVRSITDCQVEHLLNRTTCSFNRNFSGHSPAQLDVFRALLVGANYEMNI